MPRSKTMIAVLATVAGVILYLSLVATPAPEPAASAVNTRPATAAAPAASVARAAGETGSQPAARASPAPAPARSAVADRTVRGPATRMPATERALLEHGMIRDASADRMLRTGDFTAVVRRLAEEARDSPLAADLTELYSSSLRQRFTDEGGSLVLEDLACGNTVCMGLFTTTDEAAWERVDRAFMENPQARIFAIMDYVVRRDDGTIEHRIVFSTEQDSNGIALPLARTD